MSSLKDKFDDFREEPQYASWQELLKRLNTEMPVRKKRRYLLWILPVFLIGTTAAWWMFATIPSQPQVAQQLPFVEKSSVTPVATSTVTTPKEVKISTMPLAGKTKSITPAIAAQPSSPKGYTSVSVQDALVNQGNINNNTITNDNSANLPAAIPVPEPTITTPSKAEIVIANKIESKPAIIENDNLVKPIDTTSIPQNVTLKTQAEIKDKYVLEIFYAPGISNMLLKDPLMKFLSTKTIANNKNLRNGISKNGFSYTTGFGVKMNLNQDIRIKTGYYFTQINQNLYYDVQPSKCNCGDIFLAQVDVNKTIQDGHMQNKVDTISRGNTNSFTNKYSLREIPLILEYSRPTMKYKNISYVVNLGMYHMYLSGLNVLLPDADNIGFISSKLAQGTNSSYFSYYYKSTYNIIAGGGLLFKARRNVEYMIAPQFKMAVTSLSKNDRWLREYPWQMQVAFGIGKRF